MLLLKCGHSVHLVCIPFVGGVQTVWFSLPVKSALLGRRNRGPTEVWNTQNGGLQLCDRPIKLHNRPVLRAGGSTCFKFRRSRIWDESSGRSHGCPPGASTGTGAARAGTHRRRLHWIEQGCEQEVSAGPVRAGQPPVGPRSVPAHKPGSRRRLLASVILPGPERRLRITEHAAPIC
ncbi:hypothetical protein NDU88_005262 [Pleurodeles waltl]|uniref:Uncharacterized protein n=1 Tax=Pleurodeles waltl TaxID=8319 RepID=A0AAV7WU93_PLEWA|nr:hypothetical protein NDU88_005262 [Pleurodeles waltl]